MQKNYKLSKEKCTMIGILSIFPARKKENICSNTEKNKSIQSDNKIARMIDLIGKNFKAVLITLFSLLMRIED